MSGLEIAMAASAAIGAYSSISSAVSQSNAHKKNADLKRLQADELLERQLINERTMREESELAQSAHITSFSASGRSGGIGGVIRMKEQLEHNLAISRRDANFKADMLRRGADIDTRIASDAMVAGVLGGVGSLTTGAANIYSVQSQYGKPKKQTKSPFGD